MARSHYARTAGATAAIAILSILTASTSPVRGNSSTAGGVLGQSLPNLLPLPNAAGYVATQTADGRPLDLTPARSFSRSEPTSALAPRVTGRRRGGPSPPKK
jgi:hypothetical protein